MSKKSNPRKLAACALPVRGQRRSQLPHIQKAGNNQLCDPIEIFSRDRKSKDHRESYDRDLETLKGPASLGQNQSNRCLDRCCCVKPQLKDFGQLTQPKWEDQMKPGKPNSRSRNSSPFHTGFPRYLSPSPMRTGSVPYSRYASPPPPPVPDVTYLISHATSPMPQRNYSASRHLPPAAFPPRQTAVPKVSRAYTPSVRYPRRLDQWRLKTKGKLKSPTTPGGTTIDELKKYIAITGTRLPPRLTRPKVTAGRRKSIEELKQYLVTSGSFEISRAQRQSAVGSIPRTPGPPNVTPKTSIENTDTSNNLFDTPATSPLKIHASQEKGDVENTQPVAGVMVDQLQALKKLLCVDVKKVENSSQFTDEGMVPVGVATSENMWQIVESVGDVARFLDEDTMTDDPCTDTQQDPRSVVVSKKPRIKVIAEKFSKYKKNNIELRKIEEKLVCLEYDVYRKKEDTKFPKEQKAAQVMRAYFSFTYGDGKDRDRDSQFTKLKEHLVSEPEENIKKAGAKEIEIIDGHLEENHCYIQDLVKVLSHKKVIETKKNKTTLDVLSLYDMAKTQKVIDEEDIHFLNHAQLAEVREMILKTCESNTHAINRRKIQYETENPSPQEVLNVSKSIIDELYRESRKL